MLTLVFLLADAVIPLPTPQQLAWHESEFAVFIHFNMATAAGTQGCGCDRQAPPSVDLWNPSALDTNSWIDAGIAMGATRFVYTAKHGCGFVPWRTAVPGYAYSAAQAPNRRDVVAEFIASCRA